MVLPIHKHDSAGYGTGNTISSAAIAGANWSMSESEIATIQRKLDQLFRAETAYQCNMTSRKQGRRDQCRQNLMDEIFEIAGRLGRNLFQHEQRAKANQRFALEKAREQEKARAEEAELLRTVRIKTVDAEIRELGKQMDHLESLRSKLLADANADDCQNLTGNEAPDGNQIPHDPMAPDRISPPEHGMVAADSRSQNSESAPEENQPPPRDDTGRDWESRIEQNRRPPVESPELSTIERGYPQKQASYPQGTALYVGTEEPVESDQGGKPLPPAAVIRSSMPGNKLD